MKTRRQALATAGGTALGALIGAAAAPSLAKTPGYSAQQLADIEAIRQVKARYYRALDCNELEVMRAAFTADARIDYVGNEYRVTAVGRDQILKSIAGGYGPENSVSHVGHHPEITLTGPDRAEGIWYAAGHGINLKTGASTFGAMIYRDTYRRGTEGWQIASSIYQRLADYQRKYTDVEAEYGKRTASFLALWAQTHEDVVPEPPVPRALPPTLARLAEMEALRQLKHRHLRAIDTGDATLLAATLAPDVGLVRLRDGSHEAIDGSDRVAAALIQGRDAVAMHHAHLPEITLASAAQAHGIWYLQDMVLAGGTLTRGCSLHRDHYAKRDGEWRIARLVDRRLYEFVKPVPNPDEVLGRLTAHLQAETMRGLPVPSAGDLSDIEQIQQMKYRFLRGLDTNDRDLLAASFTPSAVLDWQSGTQRTPVTGLGGILAVLGHYRPDQVPVHQAHHPEIVLTGPDQAEGLWMVHSVVLDQGAQTRREAVGIHHERYRRTDGGWRIAESRSRRVFEFLLPITDMPRQVGRLVGSYLARAGTIPKP